MDKLTDRAQGYCEMYCKKYGHCFGDPGDCVFQDEVKMYESLKDYECTGMSPMDIKTMAITALQNQLAWIPVTERLPKKNDTCLCSYKFNSNSKMMFVGVLDYYAADTNPHWQHESTGLIVTHWMPLPDLPKEVTECTPT